MREDDAEQCGERERYRPHGRVRKGGRTTEEAKEAGERGNVNTLQVLQ